MNERVMLEERIYQTYRCRLEAQKRLSSLNAAWKISLLALSAAPAVASVGLLAEPDLYGVGGDAYLVALAVTSLAVSVVVAERDYGARARDMFASYRAAQRLAVEVEAYQGRTTSREFLSLRSRYQDLLDDSENHTQADYDKFKGQSSGATRRASLARSAPYLTLLLPLVTLAPFLLWVARGF